jgi:CheY-like chemotaxis protein
LRQAVGEAVTVDLLLPDDLQMCAHVDITQLETALLNLAVNARDAMPEGGKLRLSAGFAALEDAAGHSKEAICIAVEDTGTGMSPEVRERIFEPFFTTKEIGRGSGLGLSQVYGFVSQSDGEVRISSEPGVGSRFDILLPTSSEPVQPRTPRTEGEEMVGGRERILVAEDDPAVMALVVDLLQGLGYSISTAGTGDEALQAIRADPSIQLLFSDVVMPGGASGITLAREARAERPDLRILLTSGFIGDPALLHGNTLPILHKPYAAQALAAKLRELLDSPPQRANPKRRARRAVASHRVDCAREAQ